MNNKNRMTKTAGRLGRIIIFALVFALVSVVSITACACGVQAYADSTESVRIVSDLASAGTATIDVSGNVSLPDLVYVNGTKTLKGTGTLQGTSSDYIIVVNSGASLTLEGVTVSGEGISGNGIYVSEDAAFVMKSGSVQSVKGVGVRVLGKASFNGGSISKAGENWLMLDTGASADVSALECTEAGAIGIITADGSSLTLGSGVSLSGSKGNLVYNGGKAAISGSSFGDAEDYAIHNDGELKISGTDFSGSKFLGYLENAETGNCTIEKSSMKNSSADFIYNFGKLTLNKVEFDKCTSTAIESRGSKSEITVKDCTMDNIGKTAFLCKNGTLSIDKLEIAKCGGNGIHSRGCEVNGKDITIKECGAIGFLNDFPSDNDEAGVKSFTVDGFEIGHCVSYAIRSNGEYVINDSDYGTTSTGTVKSVKADEKTADTSADKTAAAASDEDDAAEVAEDDEEDEIKIDSIHDDDKTAEDTENVKEQDKDKDGKADKPHMTLSNGKVGKSDSYGLYVKGGDVILNNVKFLGTNDIGRAVIQVGYSKTPGGRLTLNEVDITGGKRGITNYSTLIMNSGNIHGNCIDNTSTSTGAGVYNAGTFIMNGGMIYGNACANSGGGVSNAKDAHFDMYGGIITQNTSGGYGGGVTNSGYFNLYNGTISKNISAKGGGGVRNACVAGLYGGVIKENQSGSSGGGLYCSASDTCVSGVCIRDNISGNNGGGIYNAGKMDIQGTSSVTGNTAAKNGGGVYNSGNLTATDGRVSGNTDAKNVAVYNYKGTLTVSGGTFDGGKYDIYLYGDVMNLSGNPSFDTMYRKTSKKTPAAVELNITGELNVSNPITVTLSNNAEGVHVLNGDRNLIKEYGSKDYFDIGNDPEDQYYINQNVNSSKCGKLAAVKVATINEGTTQYTWEEALEAASTENVDTIKVFRNCAVDGSVIEKNVTIQLVEGCDHIRIGGLEESDDYAITVSADVTFGGNDREFNIIGNDGKTRGYTAIGVLSGKLTIENGNISGIINNDTKGAAIFVDTKGTLNLNGGSITNCYSAGSGAAVYNKGTTNVNGTSMSGNDCSVSSSGIINGKDINDYNNATLTLKNVTAEDICLSNSAEISGNNQIDRLFIYNIKGGTNSTLTAIDKLEGSKIGIDVVEGQGTYPNLFIPGTVILETPVGTTLDENICSVFNLLNNTGSKKIGELDLIVLALNDEKTQGELKVNPALEDVVLFAGRGTNHLDEDGKLVSNTVIDDGTIGEMLQKASEQTEECTVYIVKPVTYDSDFTVESGKIINFYGNVSSNLNLGEKNLIVKGESHFNGIEVKAAKTDATPVNVNGGNLCLSGRVLCAVNLPHGESISLDSALTDGSSVSVKVPDDDYTDGTVILTGNGIAASHTFVSMLNTPLEQYIVGADGRLTSGEAALINADGETVETGDIDKVIVDALDGYTIKLLRKSVSIDGKVGEESVSSTTIGDGKDITFTATNSSYNLYLAEDISVSSTLSFKNVSFNGKDDKAVGQHKVTVAGAGGGLYASNGEVNFNNVVLASTENVVTESAPIRVSSTAKLNMKGGSVTGMHSAKAGGAVSNSGYATLDGVTISNCISDGNGGAIFTSFSFKITDSTITDCTSKGTTGGGAIYVNATGLLDFSDTDISGCTATGNGGAIYSGSTNVTLISGKISGNSARSGGGLATNGSGTLTLNGSSLEIIGNSKSDSGYGKDIFDSNCVFISGDIKVDELYLQGSPKDRLKLNGNLTSSKGSIKIRLSSGTNYSEGMKVLYPGDSITNDQMTAAIATGAFTMLQRTSSKPLSIYGITDSTDKKVYGQLAIDTEAKLTHESNITYGKFVDLVGASVSGDTVTVCNSFNLGVQVSVPAGVSIDGNEKTVSLNKQAAGFEVTEGTVTVSNLNVNVNVVNTVTKLTKGTFVASGGKLNIINCGLNGNGPTDTSIAGPAVKTTGGEVVISGTTISGYSTSGNGGAVYSSGGSVTIDASVITGNNGKSGKAIFSGAELKLQGAINIDGIFLKNGKFITLTDKDLKKKTGGSIIVDVSDEKWVGDGSTKILDTGTGSNENFTGAIGRITLRNKDYSIAPDGNCVGCLIAGEAVRNPAATPVYGNIADLISTASSGDTIKLLKNVELSSNINKVLTISGGEGAGKTANTLTISNDIVVSEDLILDGIAVVGAEDTTKITVNSGKSVTADSGNAYLSDINIEGDGQLTGSKIHLDGLVKAANVYLAENSTITFDGNLNEGSSIKISLEKFEDGAGVITQNSFLTADNIAKITLAQNAALEPEDQYMIDASTGKLREPADAELVGSNPLVSGSFSDVLLKASAGNTVKLLRNVSLKSAVNIDKSVIINGNGCSITTDSTNSLSVSGSDVVFDKVTVSGFAVNVSGSLSATNSSLFDEINVTGTLTVDGSEVTTLTETSGTVTVQNSASVTTLNQNGGTLNLVGVNDATAVNVYDGTVNISGNNTITRLTLASGKSINITGTVTGSIAVVFADAKDYVNEKELLKKGEVTDKQLYISTKAFTVSKPEEADELFIAPNGVLTNIAYTVIRWDNSEKYYGVNDKLLYAINAASDGGNVLHIVSDTGYSTSSSKTIKGITIVSDVQVKCLIKSTGTGKTVALNNFTVNNVPGTSDNGNILYASGGTITFNSGSISCSADKAIYAYNKTDSSLINIKGGTISCNVAANSNGKIKISGDSTTIAAAAELVPGKGIIEISGGTIDGKLIGTTKATDIASGTKNGFIITGGSFKKSNYETKDKLEAFIDTTAYKIEENGDYYVVSAAAPKLTMFKPPVFTVERAIRTLNNCATDEAVTGYLSSLTIDQLDELYNYVMNNIEAIEPPEGVDRGTRQYQLLTMIADAKFSKGEGLYNALPTYENQQDYLNTLTVKELAVLRAWVDAKQIEIGLSENDLFNLKALIDGTPYANIDNEEYLNKLDTDELQDLRNYIIANNSEGDKTSEVGIDMTDKVDAVVEKKAAENLAKLEEAGTVKEPVTTESEGETEITQEQKDAAAEEAKLQATKDAWAAAQKYISSLSEEELKALGLYIDKLQEDAYKAAQDAESAKTESDSAAVGEEATEEAKSAAAEKAKAAEEAAKAAESAEVYEDAVAVAKAVKVIGNAKEGEFFADEVLTVLLSKETTAERFEVIKGYSLENMNKLLEVISKYDTTDFTEEERVVFEAVENLVRARIVELTPVNNDPA